MTGKQPMHTAAHCLFVQCVSYVYSLKEESNTMRAPYRPSVYFVKTLHSFIHSLQGIILFSLFSFSHNFEFSASLLYIVGFVFLSFFSFFHPLQFYSRSAIKRQPDRRNNSDLLSLTLQAAKYLFTPLLKCAVECDEREMLGKRAHISLLFFCPLGWFSSFFFSLYLVPGRQHSSTRVVCGIQDGKNKLTDNRIQTTRRKRKKKRGENKIQSKRHCLKSRTGIRLREPRTARSHHTIETLKGAQVFEQVAV